jgi:phosphinothricin acetyltransferase
MSNQFSIRLITENDAEEVLNIYKPFVLHTYITFEYTMPTPDEFLQRIKANALEYPWLVCQVGNKIIGYAYAGIHRYRTAYQWSCESSVYLLPEFHRKGIATILYETLFSLLRMQGFINVYAGVSLPNEKSVGFHQSFGFKKIGIYKKVGYKFGKWHDVEWFQLHLQDHVFNPPVPKTLPAISGTDLFKQIFLKAMNARKK